MKGSGHQILQIQHLNAVVCQGSGKDIMLPLSGGKIGNVVKEQTFQCIGNQVFQLPAGTVKEYLFERTDFAGDM